MPTRARRALAPTSSARWRRCTVCSRRVCTLCTSRVAVCTLRSLRCTSRSFTGSRAAGRPGQLTLALTLTLTQTQTQTATVSVTVTLTRTSARHSSARPSSARPTSANPRPSSARAGRRGIGPGRPERQWRGGAGGAEAIPHALSPEALLEQHSDDLDHGGRPPSRG